MTYSPKYLIEPFMVLIMFGYISQVSYSSGIFQSDMIYEISKNETLTRYCLYNKEDSLCKNLTEQATGPVSSFNMKLAILSCAVGIFVNLFIGYIADRVPRRALLLSSCFSNIFISSVLLANSLVISIPLYAYYIATVIQYLGGGFSAFLGPSMAYISDISDAESRTTRIAIADGMIQLGSLLGGLVAGELMSHSTWYSTPLMSVSISVFVAFCLVVVIRDPPQSKKSAPKTAKEMLQQVVDVYVSPTPYRSRIYILSIAYLLHFTAFLSFISFFSVYLLNSPFNWQPAKIGVLHTVGSVSNFVMVMAVPLMKKASVPETVIACLSCLFCCGGFGIAIVARTFAIMAVGRVCQAGSGVALAVYRARLSKLVKPNQYGQLFQLLGVCESFALILSSLGLYHLYLATRQWFTGFAFLLLLVLQLIALLLTLWDGHLARVQSRESKDRSGQDETSEREPLIRDPEAGIREHLLDSQHPNSIN